MPGSCRGQMAVPDPLKLELRAVVSYQVSAGDKCSYLPSYLSDSFCFLIKLLYVYFHVIM